MNLIDVLVLLLLIYCAFMGFRRGLTKELVSFAGVFVIIVLAFLLKNPISSFMYENLPFFSFGGMFKGVTALNIIVYEVIAFFIVVSLSTILFKVFLFSTFFVCSVGLWNRTHRDTRAQEARAAQMHIERKRNRGAGAGQRADSSLRAKKWPVWSR